MTDIITLTDEDVQQLRLIAHKAKGFQPEYSLVADYRQPFGFALTIIEDRRMPEGFEPRTVSRRYRFAVNGRNEVYNREGRTGVRFVASGRYSDSPKALGNLVRTGDALHVLFRIGNSNEYLRSVGFVRDECEVHVYRGKRLIAVMPIDTYVGPPNGAGMVDEFYRPERDGNVA